MFISVCLFVALSNTNYTAKTQPLAPEQEKRDIRGVFRTLSPPRDTHSFPLTDPYPLPVGVGPGLGAGALQNRK